MNKEDIFIQRSLNEVTIINKKTCQKLIIKDTNLINKTDDELKSYCINQDVMSCLNNRV